MAAVRAKLAWALAGTLALLVAAALAGAVEGGPLDPPGGPASTDSVRLPGTPISGLPATLNQPGSYYLTRNLGGAAGISITASNVTLDLNGFTLTGNDTVPGISIASGLTGIHISNGQIRDWTRGIEHVSAPADDPETTVVIEGIDVFSTTGIGIHLISNAVVRDCSVTGAGARGIHFVIGSSLVENCRISGAVGLGINGGGAMIIRHCEVSGVTATAGGDFGIFVGLDSIVEDCVVHDNIANGVSAHHMRNVVVQDNAEAGISAGGTGATIIGCTARGNAGTGINANGSAVQVEGCTAEDNGGDGIVVGPNSVVRRSTAGNNGSDGIVAGDGSLIEDSAVGDNSADGIVVTIGTRVVDNVLRFNGDATAGTTDGAGIHVLGSGNYVTGNDLSSNDIGIDSDGAGNVFVQNTARNHAGGNYIFHANDSRAS